MDSNVHIQRKFDRLKLPTISNENNGVSSLHNKPSPTIARPRHHLDAIINNAELDRIQRDDLRAQHVANMDKFGGLKKAPDKSRSPRHKVTPPQDQFTMRMSKEAQAAISETLREMGIRDSDQRIEKSDLRMEQLGEPSCRTIEKRKSEAEQAKKPDEIMNDTCTSEKDGRTIGYSDRLTTTLELERKLTRSIHHLKMLSLKHGFIPRNLPTHLRPIRNHTLPKVSNQKTTKQERLSVTFPIPSIIENPPGRYTAARIAARQDARVSRNNNEHDISRDDILADTRLRPFEITPKGYDSRIAKMNYLPQPEYEDDEVLVTQIIENASQKCSNWLNNQTLDYQ